MPLIYQHFVRRFALYRRWHDFPHRHHHHWLAVSLAFLIGAYAIAAAWDTLEREYQILTSVAISRAATAAVSSPTNFHKIGGSPSTLTWTWNPVTGAAGYTVMDSAGHTLGTTAVTQYTTSYELDDFGVQSPYLVGASYTVLVTCDICTGNAVANGSTSTLDPPGIPQIEGPFSSGTNQLQDYRVTSFAPVAGLVEYEIEWGDSVTPWTLPYDVGDPYYISNSWSVPGTKCVIAKARNPSDAEAIAASSCYQVTVTAPPTYPDLVTQSLALSDPNPLVGSTITFSGEAHNQGNASAGHFYSIFCIDSGSFDQCYGGWEGEITTNPIPETSSLAAGATTAPFTSGSWTVTAGSHTVYFCADQRGEVTEDPSGAETAESNCSSVTFTAIEPMCTPTAWVNDACGAGGCSAREMHQTRTVNIIGCAPTSQCVVNAVCAAPVCNPTPWVDQGCGTGTCSSSQMHQTRTVSPSGCAPTSQCVASATCAPPPPPPTAASRADLNCSLMIDAADFTLILYYWKQPGSTVTNWDMKPDLNNNGVVDIGDVAVLMSSWMRTVTSCAPPVASEPGDYPLIGWMTFDGAVDEFYARFDFIASRHHDKAWADRVHAINPNTLLTFTQDWNVGCGLSGIPSEWFLRISDGTILDSGYGPMLNYTKFAPAATAGAHAGKTYQEACSDYMTSIDFNSFFGIFTDGLWGRDQMIHPDGPYGFFDSDWRDDIDIDNNGIDDHDEIGSVKWPTKNAWANDWQEGVDTLLRLMRQKLDAKAPGRPIILNVGSPFYWGRQWINGHIVEHYWGDVRNAVNHTARDPYASGFQAEALAPYMSVADGMPDLDDPESRSNPLGETRDHLKWMRFGLVTSMFDDYFFSNQDANYNPHAVDSSGNWYQQEHYWSFWYDEFEVELGKPLDVAKELKAGLGYRCFEQGIALANLDGTSKSITATELSGLCAGHSGTYYKVKSGQDLALAALGTWTPLHNGGQFTSATLTGVRYYSDYNYRGDGLILTITPQTLVSDIIVDNNYMSTSPTVRVQPDGYPVILSGMVQESDCGAGSNYYTVRCGWNNKSDAYAIQNSGSPRAEFVPTIGVPGQYEVFEWHGKTNTGTMASAATLTVNHAGGSTSLPLNQQINQGGWTSFGTYQFDAGDSGSVVLTNSGAGQLMADAIKFKYVGS